MQSFCTEKPIAAFKTKTVKYSKITFDKSHQFPMLQGNPSIYMLITTLDPADSLQLREKANSCQGKKISYKQHVQ